MRYVTFLVVMGLLVGCGPTRPTTISDTPKYSPGDYYQRGYGRSDRRKVVPPTVTRGQKEQIPAEAAPVIETTPTRDWEITDDRFITTHPLEMSVDVLNRTPDEINSRLKELDKR